MKKILAAGGTITPEESKVALSGVSIASVRQKFEAEGMQISAPLTVENNMPP